MEVIGSNPISPTMKQPSTSYGRSGFFHGRHMASPPFIVCNLLMLTEVDSLTLVTFRVIISKLMRTVFEDQDS